MFAIVVENPPLQWQDLPAAMQTWLLAAGGFAALGLMIGLLAYWLNKRGNTLSPGGSARAAAMAGVGALDGSQMRAVGVQVPWARWLLGSIVLGTLVAGGVMALPRVWALMRWSRIVSQSAPAPSRPALSRPALLGAELVGGWALAAVSLPVLVGLRRVRWRRIAALTRLSIKEAFRSRALWVFSILLLLFLFASWFLPYKPEDQVRNYVKAVFLVMSVLLLLTAAMLAAFSIPTDVKNQTIHTIVTKPVERFEIVIGRFLGYALLMTVVLGVMTGVSLIYVAREVNLDPEAREESFKARVPVFGELSISNPKWVGREWEYRKYIAGGASEDRAIWSFASLPSRLGGREKVRCEFSFDIFRTTKGDERTGVAADFRFETPRWRDDRISDYDRERQEAIAAGQRDDDVDSRLAEKYGLYEARSVRVEDFHTQSVEVPGALFRDPPSAPDKPVLRVFVRLVDPNQYLGMAKHDFYVLDAERGFGQNFFKGALGLWFRLCIIIGIAVTCSTYLSGIISFLAAIFLYLAGVSLPFVQDVAERKNVGGGPIESLMRIGRDMTTTRELDQGPLKAVALMIDTSFSFFLRPFLYFVPDVNRFDLTDYVADGFNVPGSMLFVHNLLPAVGYLFLWLILAYYLMRSREIAA